MKNLSVALLHSSYIVQFSRCVGVVANCASGAPGFAESFLRSVAPPFRVETRFAARGTRERNYEETLFSNLF